MLTVFGQNLYWKSSGVMDLGSGKFSSVPEFGYQGNNAQAYVKVPLAVDLVQSKAYADISVLSSFVTNPKYDGRYVSFDYGKLLQKNKASFRPLMSLIKEFSVLTPTLANDNDYTALSLTDQDRKLGVTKKIGYKNNYQKMITDYLLYIYINQNILDKFDNKDNINSLKREPIGMLFKKLDAVTPPTIDQQALQAAERMYNAINKVEDNAEKADENLETSIANGIAQTTDTDNIVDESSDATTENAVQNVDEERDILKNFDKYQSDTVLTAKQFKQIIQDNPEQYAQLLALTKEKFGGMIDETLTADVSYSFNKNNQLVKIHSISPIPNLFNDKKDENDGAAIETVLNFYDYGKAKVPASIFANAVTFEEATKEDSLVALNKKTDSFDQQKNLENLALSMLRQGKSYPKAFANLYVSQYLLSNDEEQVKNIDMAALQQTAKQLGQDYAEDNDIEVAESDTVSSVIVDAEKYEDENIADDVDEALSTAYQTVKYLEIIKQQRAKGVSDASIFSQIYQLKTLEMQSVDDEDSTLVDATAAYELQACAGLLESESLDDKSLRNLQKICDKVQQNYEAAAEQAQLEQVEQLASQK